MTTSSGHQHLFLDRDDASIVALSALLAESESLAHNPGGPDRAFGAISSSNRPVRRLAAKNSTDRGDLEEFPRLLEWIAILCQTEGCK
jgi:hypothetical protein